ncbi:Lon protease [Tetrabaena socialis]|uniref:Lon protease n=1 Tax=Tetrabaena socialis TaxID=47790 RepID=A0A2J7ZQP3_9CHLO|nr:Lon protease [Tetrabaena socialis]|eukprot:PNH02587.1 Lon protease [Tetrabaena socialis]
MYEDVAQQVYCKRNGVRIHEFGLLKHPTVAHIGASPDGISELGVMLEIKCPYRRQITGEVPVQYYYQIQGQLEVCGLQECDYLELKLEESPRPDFYDTAGHTIFPERGVVAEFYDSEAGKTVYTYSGVDWPVTALQEFECKAVERDAAVKFHYWTIRSLMIFSFNDASCISPILLDRMTIINANGYNAADKLKIATRHLIPEILKEFSMEPDSVVFGDGLLRHIIEATQGEEGVRNLKRSLHTIISNVNLQRIMNAKPLPCVLTKEEVDKFMGPTKVPYMMHSAMYV